MAYFSYIIKIAMRHRFLFMLLSEFVKQCMQLKFVLQKAQAPVTKAFPEKSLYTAENLFLNKRKLFFSSLLRKNEKNKREGPENEAAPETRQLTVVHLQSSSKAFLYLVETFL